MYNKIQKLQIKIAPEGSIFILFLIFEFQTLTHTMPMHRWAKRIKNDPECIMGCILAKEAVLDVLGRRYGGGDAG